MRRFSQRNSLVTLNDINITPLLDLAFVLLIIFVITRPLLEQNMDLNLPKGGNSSQKGNPRDALLVEISPTGVYKLNGNRMQVPQLLTELDRRYKANPNAFVAVRADENGAYKHVAAILDGCQRLAITRFSLRTSADK
jgi:biopolymer transport protein ExbD